jgi:hypothetical protein
MADLFYGHCFFFGIQETGSCEDGCLPTADEIGIVVEETASTSHHFLSSHFTHLAFIYVSI